MLASAPHILQVDATVDAFVTQLVDFPEGLHADAPGLAQRLAALMEVGAVRIRLESVTGNACT